MAYGNGVFTTEADYRGKGERDRERTRGPVPGDKDEQSGAEHRNCSSEKGGMYPIFEKYAERCSLNGVPYIWQSSSLVVKGIWSFLLLAAVGMMAYHLFRLFDTYLDFKKQTQVQLSFSNLEFPAVTICNVNPVRYSKLPYISPEFVKFLNTSSPRELQQFLEVWKAHEMEQLYGQNFVNNRVERQADTSSNSTSRNLTQTVRGASFLDAMNYTANSGHEDQAARDEYYRSIAGQESWEAQSNTSTYYQIEQDFRRFFVQENVDTRRWVGHQISDMLLRCNFAGGTCASWNFTRLDSAAYGNCYHLQHSKFISRKSGPGYALELQLFLETWEYLPGHSSSRGVQIVIHDQNTFPFPEEEGLAVRAGSETIISLRKVQIDRLGQPYGDCTPSDYYSKNNDFPLLKYTRNVCQKLCLQEEMWRTCGCLDALEQEILYLYHHKTNHTRTHICTSKTELVCALKVTDFLSKNRHHCECHSPCSETVYEKTVSSRSWPDDAELLDLLTAIACKARPADCERQGMLTRDPENKKVEFVKIVIYFEDLNYEVLKESADYELEQFISDVGGTIGLWIGLSILSVFEIFHLIAHLCLYICGCWKHRPQRDRIYTR